MDVWFCIGRNLRRQAQSALEGILIRSNARSPKRARKNSCFSLDFDLHGSRQLGHLALRGPAKRQDSIGPADLMPLTE